MRISTWELGVLSSTTLVLDTVFILITLDYSNLYVFLAPAVLGHTDIPCDL